MGTSLCQIGNHQIQFKDKTFDELYREIKPTLDNLKLVNAAFLREDIIRWYSSNPTYNYIINKIDSYPEWRLTYEEEANEFEEQKCINFIGTFGMELTFDANKITFGNPYYRYWYWFEMEDENLRNEWRKYMLQIVNAFGGNRVIYLADSSSPLEEYWDSEDTFEETEIALRKQFGEPKKTFKEVADDFQNSYFIDTFDDIKHLL